MNTMASKYEIKKLHITTDRDDMSADEYCSTIQNSVLKDYISQWVIESIEYAVKKKRKTAKVLEIGATGIVLQLEREKWKPVLQTMIDYHVEKEEYLECIKLNKLINSIE